MDITRLRLIGFKSFVEPTDLLIEPGLTGVVGPNGCGKSNLLEALRWAMGEASHKSMRAAAMDDVIFAGTASRPARNHASVTLFIDNSARKAPAEFNGSDELEIARHIEREAGSAYRVNGREARARDVKILFEDAATGARSPALVRQGQIAEIVNAKPEQRRRILEDAAGTAGLSSRRHDAELRLRAAATNLERVADVLAGLQTQITAGQRQLRAANRYREISAEIKALEAVACYVAWHDAQAEVAAAETALAQSLAQLAAVTTAETHALAAEAAAAALLPDLRDSEAACAAVLQRLRHEADRIDRDEAQARARANELTVRLAQLQADVGRETASAADAAAAIASLATEEARLSAEAEASSSALPAASMAVNAARAAEAAAQVTLDEVAVRLAAERSQRQRLNVQRADSQRQIARCQTQLAQAHELLATLHAEQAAAGLPALIASRDVVGQAVQTQELRIVAAENATTDARAAEDQARAAASQTRLAAEKLSTEQATLARLFAPPKDARWVPVLDTLKVARGYELALGAALGEDLDAPANTAAPVHWAAPAVTQDPPLPPGAEPLVAKVKGAGVAVLARRLGQVGVVARADGPRLCEHLRPGQRLVSREGDLWRWDGFAAAADAPTASARRLQHRNRLDDVEAALANARDAADTAAEDLATAAALRETAAADERTARDELRGLRQEHAALATQAAAIEKADRERENRLILLGESHRQAEAALTGYRESLADADRKLAGCLDIDQLTASHSHQQSLAQKLRAETGQAELALASASAAQLQREQRQSAIAIEQQRWRARVEASAAQIATLERRSAEVVMQLAEAEALPAALNAARARLLSETAGAQAARVSAADALASAETQARAAAKALRDGQAALSAAGEAKARAQTLLDSARQKRLAETQHIRDTFDCAPQECLAAAGGAITADNLPAASDAARRLAKLREDRDRLGGVNLSAAEELAALDQQHAALAGERADLEAAIAQLRQGIGKLTREGRKRLTEAFTAVDGHFQRLFATLFSGGEARLEMVEDPDDPLAGGLEIIAKPPGKKPATLSLLSGGEQTLTALSLIFAVFLTNPSPICVLDEVDAPLDDSNVERFCTLMEEMARVTKTRFLVITHHPMTMARMDRLFGVTMAEKGVSQLVSVDLATAGHSAAQVPVAAARRS